MIIAIDPGNIESAYCYTVYKHTCPNGKIYIGITQMDVEKRWKEGKGYPSRMLFGKAIKKYGWENIDHKILYKNLSQYEAQQREKELISLYMSNKKTHGYNVECGGQTGALGIKRSNATKEKMRKAMIGKKWTDEAKARLSKTLTGRVLTMAHRINKSLAQMGSKNHRYGTKATDETRSKMVLSQPKGINHKLSKKVVQKSIDENKIIKIWDSMGDIRREIGLKHCTISDCCTGKQKTSGGFRWEYYKEASYE